MAASNIICVDNDVEEESAALLLIEEVRLGDLVWVKLGAKRRWPGQVVDGRRVSRSSKPGKKVDGGIPVRLYGSNEYLFAEPMKYRSEFKIQNSDVFEKIFETALKQVSSHAKSRRSKGQESEFAGNGNKRVDGRNTKMKTSKPNKFQRKGKLENKNTKQGSSKSSKKDEVQKKIRPRNVKQDDMQRKRKLNSLTSNDANGTRKPEKSCKKQQLSRCSSNKETASTKLLQRRARRLRVMQSLALVAPVGSPFSSLS